MLDFFNRNVSTLKAYITGDYSEVNVKKDGAHIKSIARETYLLDEYPGLRYLDTMNILNGYLKEYRSKYTFVNFINSAYKGILLSRLYCGS